MAGYEHLLDTAGLMYDELTVTVAVSIRPTGSNQISIPTERKK